MRAKLGTWHLQANSQIATGGMSEHGKRRVCWRLMTTYIGKEAEYPKHHSTMDKVHVLCGSACYFSKGA